MKHLVPKTLGTLFTTDGNRNLNHAKIHSLDYKVKAYVVKQHTKGTKSLKALCL